MTPKERVRASKERGGVKGLKKARVRGVRRQRVRGVMRKGVNGRGVKIEG